MQTENTFENRIQDSVENYGGHHIDDRMRARGSSYASYYALDNKEYYTTKENLEEKKHELEVLRVEYANLQLAMQVEYEHERLVGEDLAGVMAPIEKLGAKIENLKRFIKTARVVEPEVLKTDTVQLFSQVTLKVAGQPQSRTFRIIGEGDTSAGSGISCSSPVGKALLGRRVGESVVVEVNQKNLCYTIMSLN